MIRLELDDIQDILLGYPRFPHTRFLFLRFRAAAVLAISLVKCRKKFGARLDRAEADRRNG